LVKAGEVIMDVAADRSTYVIGYLRDEQQYIHPAPGMPVEVRPRKDPKHVVQATVDTVGAQMETVPTRLLRDQKIQEWGLPVRLTIPANADLRPGEMVYLAFKKTQ